MCMKVRLKGWKKSLGPSEESMEGAARWDRALIGLEEHTL